MADVVDVLNARRFDRFMRNLREGVDYAFLSLYFYTVDEAHEIARELEHNSTLKFLSIPNCYAGRRKVLPIMTALKQNELSRLIYIDLNDNRLEDMGCYVVCDFLKSSRTVQSVALRANRITGEGNDSGAKYLSDVLKVNNVITRLEIGQNKFGPEGAAMLDEALGVNRSLEFLDISGNDLKAEGIANLKNLFLKNPTIRVLQLHHNNIGADGAEQLAEFMAANMSTGIEKLTLLDKYTRVLILRGLLDRCRIEDVTKKFLEKFLFPGDFFDRKIQMAQTEWEAAKRMGQELVRLPQEVFEYQDAEAIKAFLKAALVQGLSANKGVKMLMVGRARAGKTSLTNSLVNDESGLTKDDDQRATVSVEIRPWKVKDVTISVWDFAGQEEYYMTHTFFLSRRCVVVLIVDLAKYRDFMDDVYYWVKAIQAHIPGVSFFLVGTHIDEMTPKEINDKCADILIKFQEEERRVVAALDKQLEMLEESNTGNFATIGNAISSDANGNEPVVVAAEDALRMANNFIEGETNDVSRMNKTNVVYLDSAQMSRVREQRDKRPSILHNKVYAASSRDMEGVPELRQAVIAHATNEEVAIRLPNSYVKLLDKLKTYGDEHPATPIVTRNQVGDVVGKEVYSQFDDEDEVDAALELLHLVGQLLWYRSNTQLMDRVFVSPRWVVDITKALIRHDMFLTEHGNPGIIECLPRPNNIKTKDFELMKKKFREEAVFDMRFLALLETWRNISELDRYKLVSLLKEFDLIIPLPKRRDNSNDECLIPLYLKSTFHGKTIEEPGMNKKLEAGMINLGFGKMVRKSIAGLIGLELDKKDLKMDPNRVTWRYDLHEYFPEGIFFRLLVRCYSLGKVKTIEEDTLYSKLGNDIKVVIKEDRKNNHILIAASHKTNLQLVWPALVLFAAEFEDLLRTAYKGVTTQVVCIAADSRLRERALCTHEEHKDMVPPLEYMHVVWGNINAVQVGVLLRLKNMEEQLMKIGKKSRSPDEMSMATSQQFGSSSEINLLGKEAFSLLERLLQNICKVNDIPIRNGRTLEAYLNSIKDSEQYKARLTPGSKWEGEYISDDKLAKAEDLYNGFNELTKTGELLDFDFVMAVIEVGKAFIPNLDKMETEYQRNLKNLHQPTSYEPTAQFLKERQDVAFDAVRDREMISPTAEAIGTNEQLKVVNDEQQKESAEMKAAAAKKEV